MLVLQYLDVSSRQRFVDWLQRGLNIPFKATERVRERSSSETSTLC